MRRLAPFVVLLACSHATEAKEASPPLEGLDLETAQASYAHLSDYGLFDAAGTTRAGMIAYDLTTPLFSDYTQKQRFVWMPPGRSAAYRDPEPFEFPVGTILVKTFLVPKDLRRPEEPGTRLETRLLVRNAKEWIALPYVWNDARTDADLKLEGAQIDIAWTGSDGAKKGTKYLVPNALQCARCHAGESKTLGPIGPKARTLNRELTYDGKPENQLAHWARVGVLSGAAAAPPRLPTWNDTSTGSVSERARAWLESNCAHCHDTKGTARTTGLYLTYGETDPLRMGICKPPAAAGRGSGGLLYDVVPGKPDESIVAYRIASTEEDVMMPEIGRSVVHAEGVELVRAWIAGLAGACK